MKHMTSCAAEDFSWERVTRQQVFRPNVKNPSSGNRFSPFRSSTDTHLHQDVTVYDRTLQILRRQGGKKPELCFLPSPLLFLLYTFCHFPSLCQALTLSPLLHCFPVPLSLFGFPSCSATHRTSTRSQEHAKYVPTRLLHVVMFSKSCAANKAAMSQISRRRPEEVQLMFKTKANVYSYVFLKTGTNK